MWSCFKKNLAQNEPNTTRHVGWSARRNRFRAAGRISAISSSLMAALETDAWKWLVYSKYFYSFDCLALRPHNISFISSYRRSLLLPFCVGKNIVSHMTLHRQVAWYFGRALGSFLSQHMRVLRATKNVFFFTFFWHIFIFWLTRLIKRS